MERKNVRNITPSQAIHPGVFLKRELKQREIKQRELAEDIGVSVSQLNEIIKGKRSFSTEIALLLEAYLGTSAVFWLNLQAKYEVVTTRKSNEMNERTKRLKEWQEIKKLIPYSFFKKEKLVTGNKEEDISKIFDIYGVQGVRGLSSEVESLNGVRFRKSSSRQVNNINLTGWVKTVEYHARHKRVKIFKKEKKETLVKELRGVFSGSNILLNVEKLLAEYGIIFIVQAKADKVPVDGIASWKFDNPHIAVSLRYKRLDNLAFTIFHEIAHVFLHLAKNEDKYYIDDIEAGTKENDKDELEANQFAANALIPEKDWIDFMERTSKFSSDTLKEFSSSIGIHPAVTLGRLRREHNEFYRRRFSIPNEII